MVVVSVGANISSRFVLSRMMLLMLPLFLRLQSEIGKGDKGKKTCGGKDIVEGGDGGAGESRGDREIMLVGTAKKRSSISIEFDSFVSSSIVEIGCIIVVITASFI